MNGISDSEWIRVIVSTIVQCRLTSRIPTILLLQKVLLRQFSDFSVIPTGVMWNTRKWARELELIE